jgi:hypothetical protein
MSPIALQAEASEPVAVHKGLHAIKNRLAGEVTIDPPSVSDFVPTVDRPFDEVHPDGSYKVLDQPLGMRRKLRVICMGGGASGINMAQVPYSHARLSSLSPQVQDTVAPKGY